MHRHPQRSDKIQVRGAAGAHLPFAGQHYTLVRVCLTPSATACSRVGHVVDGDDPAVGVQVDDEGGDDAATTAHHDARPDVDVDDFGCHISDFDALIRAFDRTCDPPGDIGHAEDRTHRLSDPAAAVGPQCDLWG